MEGLILSIDSSTSCCSVAVSTTDRVLSEVTFNLRMDGGRRLSPVIRDLLGDLSLTLKDLSAVAVSRGPGSFTGLRIGVATAKALAMANGLPLYSANSLLVLAFNARLSRVDICPVMDARKGEVYAALYRFDEIGCVEKSKPVLTTPENLVAGLPKRAVLVGDGALRYREVLRAGGGDGRWIAPAALAIPRASYLACLVRSGTVTARVDDVMGFEPLYLRIPEAEVKWRERTGRTR